jgi:hypothetical protein
MPHALCAYILKPNSNTNLFAAAKAELLVFDIAFFANKRLPCLATASTPLLTPFTLLGHLSVSFAAEFVMRYTQV